MKKLYRGVKKRIAKKWIGRAWYKLNLAKDLRPGDLVSTCKGYNERIKEIVPLWNQYRGHPQKGRVICDFNIITESGTSCSIVHCCTLPLESKQKIIEYFMGWLTPKSIEWCEKYGWPFHKGRITTGLSKGEDVFDEDGQPYFEYCDEYEKKARFPSHSPTS